MKWHCLAATLLVAQIPVSAMAQPADQPIPAAASTELPAGISTAKTPNGAVYVDAQGRTLYGLDLRAIIDRTADGLKYCQGPCLEEWEPLLAPAGAVVDPTIGRVPGIRLPGSQPGGPGAQQRQGQGGPGQPQSGQGQGQTPQAQAQGGGGQAPSGQGQAGQAQGRRNGNAPASDWSVAEGPKGPQWVYKRWHLVFTRKGDEPGRTDKDGHENFAWNTLKYVPPAPKIKAPSSVTTALVNGDYVLVDKDGRALFTGNCQQDCRWLPLQAGAGRFGVGDWTVDRSGDTPQWIYRGNRVFVSQEEDPRQAPSTGTILRP